MCADLSVHSEPQTTLPAPTTTLSSSSYCKISDSTTASEDANTGSIAVFIDHQLLLLQIAMTQNEFKVLSYSVQVLFPP